MKINKYVAELIATFSLTFAVSISIISGTPLATPVVAALVLGVFVYTIGPISGAHLNPAVTLGLLSIGKVKGRDAVIYIISQIVGAVLAMVVVQGLTDSSTGVVAVDSLQSGFAEALGAFILVFGISSVVYGKASDHAAGLVIGGSLLAGLMLTGGMSNAVLNPAVAIGIGSVSAVYLIAPIVGGTLGALVYRWIK
jgi:aquaporin Z